MTEQTHHDATALPDDPIMKARRWRSLIAAALGWTLDAMDWMLLSLALTLIGKEFNLQMTDLGLLATATLAGAALSGLFMGVIADYFGRVKLLTITMVWYAVTTAACGFAQSYTQLIILRFLTGIGLGGEWGIGAALVSEYWPEKYRARATCFVHSGWPIGYGLASLAYMYIVPVWGWRALFFLGVIPAFVALWVRLSVPEPEEWQRTKERRDSGEVMKFPLATLFGKDYLRITLLAIVWTSGSLMAYWGAATWLPAFLSKAKQLDIVRTGAYLIVLNAGAFFGYQFYGWLADTKGRRWALIFGAMACIVATLIYVSIDSPTPLLLFGPVFGFFTYGLFGIFGAYISELFPAQARATGTSLVFNSGRGLSMLSPVIIGSVAAAHGLVMGLGVTALFNLIAMVALVLLPETAKLIKKAKS